MSYTVLRESHCFICFVFFLLFISFYVVHLKNNIMEKGDVKPKRNRRIFLQEFKKNDKYRRNIDIENGWRSSSRRKYRRKTQRKWVKKCDLLHEIWDILRVWQHEKMTSSIKKREEELILVRVGATVVKKNYFFLKREINGMIMRIYFSRRFDQLGNISNKN